MLGVYNYIGSFICYLICAEGVLLVISDIFLNDIYQIFSLDMEVREDRI